MWDSENMGEINRLNEAVFVFYLVLYIKGIYLSSKL